MNVPEVTSVDLHVSVLCRRHYKVYFLDVNNTRNQRDLARMEDATLSVEYGIPFFFCYKISSYNNKDSNNKNQKSN